MTKLDTEIETALKKYDLGMEAVWAHKQSGKYIMYHWACEHIAIKAGVTWDRPAVISADPEKKIAVVCVFGKLGDREEWSFGEAAPYNTQQTYPFAMAEKRGKDRCLLKLIGLHGKIYSEEESDDFKTPKKGMTWTGPLTKTKLVEELRRVYRDLRDCTDLDQFDACYAHNEAIINQARIDMPTEWEGPVEDGKPYKEALMELRDRIVNPMAVG